MKYSVRLLNALPSTFQDLAKAIYFGLKNSQIQLLSSSLAFTTLFALVPLLAVFLSAFKAFGGVQSLFLTFEPIIMNYLAPSSGESIVKALRASLERTDIATIGFTGFFFLIVSAMRLMLDVENAFRIIWHVKKGRSWTIRILIFWGLIIMAPIGMAVVVGFLTAQSLFSISDFDPQLLGAIALFITLFILYKVIPPTHVEAKHALISSVSAGIVIIAAKSLYQYAANYMITYNKIYGSLASIPFFLFWLVIVWWIVLGGAILAAALKERNSLSLEAKPPLP